MLEDRATAIIGYHQQIRLDQISLEVFIYRRLSSSSVVEESDDGDDHLSPTPHFLVTWKWCEELLLPPTEVRFWLVTGLTIFRYPGGRNTASYYSLSIISRQSN